MDSRKKYKLKQKELGLCLSCPKKALSNKNFCAIHSHNNKVNSHKWYIENKDRHKKSMLILRKNYIENNQCPTCSMPLLDEDIGVYVSCESCRIVKTIPKKPKGV